MCECDQSLIRFLLAEHEELSREEEDGDVDGKKREEREMLHRNERCGERLRHVEIPAQQRVRVEVGILALHVALCVVLVVAVSPPRCGSTLDKPFEDGLDSMIDGRIARDPNVTTIMLRRNNLKK